MIQVVCEKCEQPISEDEGYTVSHRERERVRVGVSLGWDEPIRLRDYHRECARELSVAGVYARSGLLPL